MFTYTLLFIQATVPFECAFSIISISSRLLTSLQIWCTDTLTPLYIVHPYLGTDSGDLFSLTYIASLCTVYIGCQNTSLQWLDLKELCQAHAKNVSRSIPYGRPQLLADNDTRRHSRSKFFDSQAPWEERSGGSSDGHRTPNRPPRDIPMPLDELNMERDNVIDSAHYGYVYSMSVIPPSPEHRDREDQDKEVLLVTGSGDESVKVSTQKRCNVPALLIPIFSYGNAHQMDLLFCIRLVAAMALFCQLLLVMKQFTRVARKVRSRLDDYSKKKSLQT